MNIFATSAATGRWVFCDELINRDEFPELEAWESRADSAPGAPA